MTTLNGLSAEDLERMLDAASVVSETMRVLQKSSSNLVAEILRTEDQFREWDHIPEGDVFDHASGSQYYYHAHAKSEDGSSIHDDEHGHFHTFLRGKSIPDTLTPVTGEDSALPAPDDIITHFIGIGMDRHGTPMRLFTTNRWVTGDVWYKADDLISLLDRFEMDLSWPSWPLNLWLSNMFVLFRPQIEQLLHQRDAAIAQALNERSYDDVFEDRDLEVTSHLTINLAEHVAAVDAAFSAH